MNNRRYLRLGDRASRRLVAATLLTALLMAVLLIAARRTAPFVERVEAPLYDGATQLIWPWNYGHDEIVLVTQQQDDPHDNPLPDNDLATVLELILQGNPSVIAVDLARPDKNSVAPDPDALKRLQRAVGTYKIVWGYTLNRPEDPFRNLPSYLRELTAEENLRYLSGFAEFPVDGDSATDPVRRAITKRTGRGLLSLAATAALTHTSARVSPPDNPLAAWDRLEGWWNTHFSLAPDFGGYTLGGTARNEFLLKYGPDLNSHFEPRNYSLDRLAELARQGKLRATFENKIVFLGTERGGGGQDEKRGIGNPELRGVKLHALAAGQILRELPSLPNPLPDTLSGLPPAEPAIRSVPNWLEDALIVLFGLGTVLVFLRWPALGSWQLLAVLVLLAALSLGLEVTALAAGYWVPMAGPTLVTAGAGFTTIAMLFAHARSRADQAYKLLENKVGAALARLIWDNRTGILSNRKVPTRAFTGTVLFTDLAGYNAAAKTIEQLAGPEAFADWIGTYMQHMIRLVTEHHGFVKDFEGDAIMAVFGFPPDGTDSHAANAVRCTLAMERQFRILNTQLADGFPPYQTRLGIYSGDIVAEHLHTEFMYEFAFNGLAVNNAKRLETFEKDEIDWNNLHARILISGATNELMGSAAEAEKVPGPSKIDARNPPEYIWEVTIKT